MQVMKNKNKGSIVLALFVYFVQILWQKTRGVDRGGGGPDPLDF